jgi:hypothetical protein
MAALRGDISFRYLRQFFLVYMLYPQTLYVCLLPYEGVDIITAV